MPFTSELQLDGFAAATKRDLQNAQRDTWRFIGLWWHRTLKAVKFTKRGATRYKYAPRSGNPGSGRRFKGSYAQAKVLKTKYRGLGVPSIGENKPNVWSGRSRASAMAGRKVKATASSSGKGSVDITINAPALNFKNPKSKAHPRKEVTATTSAEISEMERVSLNRFEKNVTRIRRKKTLRS